MYVTASKVTGLNSDSGIISDMVPRTLVKSTKREPTEITKVMERDASGLICPSTPSVLYNKDVYPTSSIV